MKILELDTGLIAKNISWCQKYLLVLIVKLEDDLFESNKYLMISKKGF